MPAGSAMTPYIHFEYAVYMLPAHTKDPRFVLQHALAKDFTKLKLVDELLKQPQEMLVKVRTEENVQGKYSPPDAAALEYSGYGLTKEQGLQLQQTREAFILDFAHPKENIWTALRNADELMEKIARETGGLVWDEETREVFTPDAWHKRRIADWRDTVPSISTHTVVHVYNNGEFVRAISLGMVKAGLPDLVVEELPQSDARQVVHIINCFSQCMVEGNSPKKMGQFRLDLRAIQNAAVRDSQVNSLKPNGTGVACLSLREAVPEEGDPKNRIIEITFDRYAGNDVHARQDAALSLMFGWEDSTRAIEHTDELLEESRREKSKLPQLHKDFDAGLPPGDYILVKAPFKTVDGGNEWMWVEIRSWNHHTIRGLLQNQPEKIPGLNAGQSVEVQEADLFDYIRHYADGRDEGNTTRALVQKMGEKENKFVATKSALPDCVE
jgi:uncharacterized protein YegJ (DUF2314 family)